MFQLTHDSSHRKHVNKLGMFPKTIYVCTTCFTPITFFEYCAVTCPGCLEIIPPINELSDSSKFQRIAYHKGKLL